METKKPNAFCPLGKEWVWVFVGCGGTFYAAASMYAILIRRYGARAVLAIDPDTLEEKNYDRQWPGHILGRAKAILGRSKLYMKGGWSLVEQFDPLNPCLVQATRGRPVLAIVNVDNDQARLEVREWLASRLSPGIMVDSGCNADHGQSWAGIWDGNQCIHDWLAAHPSVGTLPARRGQCSIQTAMSNSMTALCSTLMIEEIAGWLSPGGADQGTLNEYEWQAWPTLHETKLWTSTTPLHLTKGDS